MSRCTLLIFCFVITCSPDLFGQHIIKGTVSDSLSNPIPYVQVLVYDSTNTGLIDFTQGDSTGRYELDIEKPGNYYLTFNILSHKPRIIPVELDSSNSDSLLVLNVILSPDNFKLEEVIVETERSIRVRGDTIAMKVDDFRRGDEEVVEDVLSKLPGFDVDEDGIIRFAGKQISKVMVEGSDLFGKGYSMLTKNLDANTIDEVEILQNYMENPELKGLAQSDDVALNLNLKDELKLSLFGNATLGINSLKKHEARVVLTSLNKKTKQYILLNSNSIGKNALGDLNQFNNSDNSLELSNSLVEMNINAWKEFESYLLPLDAQRMRFNNTGLASYNFFYKLQDNFELKLVSIGAFDEDLFNKETHSIFYTENAIVRDQESHNLKDKVRNGFGKIASYFKPNSKSKLEYDGYLKYGNTDAKIDAFTLENELLQDYQSKDWETAHLLKYSNRIDSNNALILNAKYNREEMEQQLFADPLFAGDLFGEGANSLEAYQDGTINFKSIELNALWLKRFSKIFSMEVTGSSSIAQVNDFSVFHLNGIETASITLDVPGDYSNSFDFLVNSSGVLGRLALGDINIFSGVEVSHLDFNYKNTLDELSKSDKLLIKPELGLDWNFTKNKIQISYLYDTSVSSIGDLNDGYRFRDNRTLTRGLGQFHTYRGHNVLAQYTYGGWLRRNMLHATFIYNKNEGVVANNAKVTNEYSLISNTLETNREIYFAHSTADFLLPGLKNNLKISGNYTFRSEGSFINDNYYLLKTSIKAYGFDLRSVFDGMFNYTFGASWLHQDLNTESHRIRMKQFQYSDLYFQISKAIKFQFVAEREVVRHEDLKNAIYLLDAFFHMQIKPNKLDCTVELRNILNNSYYVTNSLSGLRFSSTRYDLVPRSLLFSLKYRL